SHEAAATLQALGATPVRVSLFDVGALTPAVAGHDAVVNLATSLPSMWRFAFTSAWRTNTKVRTEGSTALVTAALASGVPRYLQESVSMLYPDRGDAWIDESVAVDSTPPAAAANLAAEAQAQRFADQGGTRIVLRFGLFYGPTASHSEVFVATARRHLCIQMGPPGSYVSSIHVDDGGAAVVALLDAPSGIYNVVDDEPLTKQAFSDALAAAVGKRPWLRVPGRAGLLLGKRTTTVTRSIRVSNAKLRGATGWAPRYPSAREGWPATVADLARR
ncbi:MAG TPA: NAD(P)-dependent oxidoreductase, partial [Acidimicrobiales bacterium]|nr:NAD(P)-dependent oxidoreductase [Acidimicrobiales bacterium]